MRKVILKSKQKDIQKIEKDKKLSGKMNGKMHERETDCEIKIIT